MIARATTSAAARRLTLLVVSVALAACANKDGTATTGKKFGRFASRHARFRHAATWSPATLTEVRGVPIAELKTALAQRLADKPPAGSDADSWKHMQSLYKSMGETPLWLTSDGLATDRARALTDAVLKISDDGLRLDDYPIAPLTTALAALKNTAKPTAQQYADVDVLLSATYAGMGKDLLVGQISPKSVGQAWHIDPSEENVDSALVHALGDTLERGIAEMRPADSTYAALQKELVHYRDIESKGDWPRVPAGKTLKAGQSDSPARLAALRARLTAEGYDGTAGSAVPASASTATTAPPAATKTKTTAAASTTRPAASGVYGAALADEIGRYQARHGITVDKRLSPETINSLNVPVAYRLGQLAANLERQRWMPRSLGSRYVYVNVPAFELTAYDSGETSLNMKVIVGQEFEDKATPVFSDTMQTVVFRPFWNITPDIQRTEIEPKIASDASYLERENLEYFTDGGERRIRQKPGGKNSLGLVKFLFPNSFNIYLHDTPNHELFNKDVRAFSHGCIRLEKPAELAQWVLGWDAARVQQAMESGPDNVSVRVPERIPVYITYGTAYVRDGQLSFGNDLYHRDEQLVKAAARGALLSSEAVAALQALRKITTS
jgi:murein L,D-transpeptidase YcbB/YkuD